MAASKRMTITPDNIYATVNRLKKSRAGEFHFASGDNNNVGQRRERAHKLPFTPLENQREESPMMAHRRPSFDPHNENTLLVGNKLPRSNGGKIKDKISLWEGKEPTHSPITSGSLGQCHSITRTESLTKNGNNSDGLSEESCKRVAQKEKENLGKENVGKLGDSRPCSPVETGKQQRGTLKNSKHSESKKGGDCGRIDHEKENVEKLRDSRPCSPSIAVQQQMGTLKKSNERKTAEQANQEKRAVFTLFKNLDAMGENHGKSPPELGNYFSPPCKDKQVVMGETGSVKETQHQENVYTEPGSPPINPVPKPQRTFEHPTIVAIGKSQSKGREQRNLPPLPSTLPPTSTKTSSKPPSGVYGRPWGARVRDNIKRKSFEFEDLKRSTSPLFSRLPEHHYEDIPDSSKENPYEDIELESQCSQQSLPSSPGAETTKTLRPGFFRQNSGRGFKLLDLRRSNQSPHSTSSGGVSSLPQLSPPSTPGPEHTYLLPGDPYSRTCRRIPTVVLRINSIFEAKIGKKHLRRIYHYAETSSGRVTDENSDSESEVEERSRAHRQRLVSVQSILSQPSQAQVHYNGSNTSKRSREKELHQRQLFEYFLVVSLQKSKAGAHYLPEVTQQFPPKLERSFKFMRETEDQLRIIPQFCFPDAKDWEPVENFPSEMFSFVLTGEDGSRRFGYCRRLLPSGKGKRLPEVYCIVSHLGCFNLFSKVLDEVERRRALSPALVQPFMRAIMEAQFPAPGRTITIKTFLPGSGTEVMELCRPSDSRLEHVDFECLFSCLSLRLLLRVLGSLLLERRVIFTADKLSTLSQCCHAVVALLYPFVWQHTYIPVLPSAMLDIVCTPTPFLVGLLSSSLPQLTELPLEEVLVVDLENSRFLRQLDDEDSILPSKLQSALENVLERRRELANERGGDTPGDSGHLSTVVSEAFVRFFVELVGHYPLFITGEREDGYSSSSSSSPVPCYFQRESFRKAIPSKTVRRFLEVFMETQMFGWFIQERELQRQALRGLFEVRVQEYLDSIHENEHRRVNRFLKGLGNKMKFLSKK
ncbi:DENN domain-containing protein 2A-like isoform X1 [Gymnodraco acuticeps]|uniref:DENN domain-containing protein 2A-like isoform X1 n=1 Tax=Gymnodraco acuticeps TaxID=8218 RepID=A0A6P8VII5_GYMAC|nr:DENN domain-containing protein 2A-like isoform X1 [Gymnodraco acuticeps]XP_034090200.1 DENN domain-containing protein 2A-like isoform X1 [Gymnodraco acuticeps]XP_034090201.1 DENN domain-containing protein 2A-like isoform X1 [Gymnodraco acuticeps]